MPGIRQPKPLSFRQIDLLLKKELGATYASHDDKEIARFRMSESVTLPEEEEDMSGLFDELIAEGVVDFDEIPLNPWAFEDGKYKVVLETIEFDPSDDPEKFAHKLKFEYTFHPDEPKYRNRKYFDNLSIPAAAYEERKEGAKEQMIARTVQRLAGLGLSRDEIKSLNVVEMNNKLRGGVYIMDLYTPAKDNPNETQYCNSIKRVRGDANSASSVLDI